jgi:hypothetical protein
LTTADLPELVAADRLQLCLVRCNACRFTTYAQDVAHLVAIIEASQKDYVRDVSLMLDVPPPKPAPPQKIPRGTPAYGHSDADPGLCP